jgi:hypothetical protein
MYSYMDPTLCARIRAEYKATIKKVDPSND